MESAAWDLLLNLSGRQLIDFLGLVGCFGAVCAGIPTLILAVGGKGVGPIVPALAFVHGALLVFGPAILLGPLFRAHPSAAIGAGLLYGSMLLVRLIFAFPRTPLAAVQVAALPWLLGLVVAFLERAVSGLPGGSLVGDVLLSAGLVSFAGFWLSFPAFFFARSSWQEQVAQFRRIPGLYVAGLGVLVLALAFGAWVSWQAFLAAQPAGLLPIHGAWIVLLSIGVQVVLEARIQVRAYRDGPALRPENPADRPAIPPPRKAGAKRKPKRQ